MLPYSFELAPAPPIPNPIHPFGLIKRTDVTNTIQLTIRRTIKRVFIIYKKDLIKQTKMRAVSKIVFSHILLFDTIQLTTRELLRRESAA